MRIVRWIAVFAVVVGGGMGPVVPAVAAPTGVVSLQVTGLKADGRIVDLAGASVIMRNLDSGQEIHLPPQGDPSVSPFYASLSVPYGRYTIGVTRQNFVTRHWPSAFSSQGGQTVWVGEAPGCDETLPALCVVHRFEIQLHEAVPLTGRVRTRDGRGVANVAVQAERADEPTYRPTTVTAADGTYTMQLPPGTYVLRSPDRRTMPDAPVLLTSAATRDLVLLGTPAPPQDVTTAAGDSRLSVSWRPPVDDGGSPVTSYRAVATPGGVHCTTSGTGCTLEGLQNGQAYRVSVTAENAIGPGEPSWATTPSAPTMGLPAPVRNVRVSPGSRTLTVTWSAPHRGEATEYVAKAFPGGRSCSTDSLECTIRELRNGTAYRVEVFARSDAGRTAAVTAERRVRPAGPPSAPRNVQARPIRKGLRVSWNTPHNDGGHRIRRYVATVWPGGRTCVTRRTTCSVRGLDPRANYSVTVRARSSAGDGAISPGSMPVRPTR